MDSVNILGLYKQATSDKSPHVRGSSSNLGNPTISQEFLNGKARDSELFESNLAEFTHNLRHFFDST